MSAHNLGSVELQLTRAEALVGNARTPFSYLTTCHVRSPNRTSRTASVSTAAALPKRPNCVFTFLTNTISTFSADRTWRKARIEISMSAQANGSLPSAARWVDNNRYFGPDRRRAFYSVVNNERRVVNAASNAPSLWSALRKLRFHAMDAYGQTGVDAFIGRLKGVALLAEANDETEIWEELTVISVALSANPRGQDPRAEILRKLDSVCTRGSAAG